MKKWYPLSLALLAATVALFVWATSALAQSQTNLIVRIHFAGADRIANDANSAAFTNEFCSSQARALESQTLDKLSRQPGIWYQGKYPPSAGDGSPQLRPLLDDFLKSEWILEIGGTTASPEYALAIRLDDGHARVWQDSLKNLLESWTGIKVKNISGGWELKKDLPPNLFRIVRKGDWVVIGCGQDKLPLSDAWPQDLKIPGDETSWVNADVDWPRLTECFPVLAKFDFPAFKMNIIGQGGTFQWSGKINLSQPLPPLQSWMTPTNIIHSPLTSFTAVRGFTPWLKNQDWAKLLELSPEPDQLFIWSQGQMSLQTYVAAPVSNATNALAQLGQNLTSHTNWENYLLSPFAVEQTPQRIALTDVPFISPEILALHEAYGDFIFADGFPNLQRGKALPPELLQALQEKDLVLYHWEVTADRLKDLQQFAQLGLLLTHKRQLPSSSAAEQWLNVIGQISGPSVTQITQNGPTELNFNRTAPDGLTASELIALANWLEAPDFPGCDLSLPKVQFRPIHGRLKKLSAPTPVPPGP
jgi:hypothetical protein